MLFSYVLEQIFANLMEFETGFMVLFFGLGSALVVFLRSLIAGFRTHYGS